MLLEASLDACSNCCKMNDVVKSQSQQQATRRALARTASFIRAHDLDLAAEDVAKCAGETSNGDGDGDEHRTDSGAPSIDVDRRLICVSSGGEGSGAVMSALLTIGLDEATDESGRWSGTSGTEKFLKKRAKQLKKYGKAVDDTGAPIVVMGPWTNAASGRDVLVWSSKCTRKGYGSDYPVVKSRGLIPAPASAVVELIKDSARVTEYNKMSLGREDEAMLLTTTSTNDEAADAGVGGIRCSVHRPDVACPRFGVPGEAKIMNSRSQPPLTRKPLEFKTLFYARKLTAEDGWGDGKASAYITVGRSVWETAAGTDEGSDGSATRCEVMLSVNLVRDVEMEDGEEWCELTMIAHAVSPGIPIFVGKQLGLVAAENYIKDIRALFEK